MAKYAAAIDQGTTSTRCMVFDHGGNVVSVAQKEHEQIYPEAGLGRARRRRDLGAHAGGRRRGARRGRRERRTTSPASASPTSARRGRVGQDDRRADLQRDRLAGHAHGQARRRVLGATAARRASRRRSACRWRPTSPGPKIRWILDNVDGAAERADSGDLLFGNMDTWLIWNLTGGTDGGLHITDVTNASRTMLMDLETLDWDDEIMRRHGRPARDAAGDPVLERGLRRGPLRRRAAGRADRGRPRRPAGGDVRPDLLLAGRGEEHLRHRQLPAAQHGHRGASRPRTAC